MLIQLFFCLVRQLLHVDLLEDQLVEIEVLDVQGVRNHLNGLGDILCIEYRDSSMAWTQDDRHHQDGCAQSHHDASRDDSFLSAVYHGQHGIFPLFQYPSP